MAATAKNITVASNSSNGNLKQLFNQVRKVFYVKEEITQTKLTSTGYEADMEFPILGDGVSFNGPDVEKSEIKLTDGTIWTSKMEAGDSDISLQIATIADKIMSTFMEKKTASPVEAVSSLGTGESITYSGLGYAMGVKTVKGALVMFDQSGETMIVLPNVEMTGQFNGADGDNPAYINATVTPLLNSDNVNIYVFQKKTAA